MAQTPSLGESRHPGAWSAPAAAWRTQAAIMSGLDVANWTSDWARIDMALIVDGSLLDWVAYKGDLILRVSWNVITAVAALQFVQRLPAARPHRTPVAVLAMLVAALVGAALAVTVFPWEPMAVQVGGAASTASWFWYVLWWNTVAGLITLAAVGGLRGRQEAATQLAEAQERGRLARQQLAAARLSAIQARVDPQLLFDMLSKVKGFYERDAPRAERLLDDLSAFLRAALPRLRSEHSTLTAELALVQAYVRLLSCAGTASIELVIRVPPDSGPLGFPAGVLLPLLAADRATPRRVTLQVSTQDGALRVLMNDTAMPGAATLGRLRRSLSDLYGERSKLHALGQGASAQLELEVPLEPA
jgi:type II secretory pathway pseudopilin PulG